MSYLQVGVTQSHVCFDFIQIVAHVKKAALQSEYAIKHMCQLFVSNALGYIDPTLLLSLEMLPVSHMLILWPVAWLRKAAFCMLQSACISLVLVRPPQPVCIQLVCR